MQEYLLVWHRWNEDHLENEFENDDEQSFLPSKHTFAIITPWTIGSMDAWGCSLKTLRYFAKFKYRNRFHQALVRLGLPKMIVSFVLLYQVSPMLINNSIWQKVKHAQWVLAFIVCRHRAGWEYAFNYQCENRSATLDVKISTNNIEDQPVRKQQTVLKKISFYSSFEPTKGTPEIYGELFIQGRLDFLRCLFDQIFSIFVRVPSDCAF